MGHVELQMEALLMNEEEAQAVREREKWLRRRKVATAVAKASHQRYLQNAANYSTSPPQKQYANLVPVPVEEISTSYKPQSAFYKPPEQPKPQQKQQQKAKKVEMPVTKIGVLARPKPLSPQREEADIPLQTYDEWKNQQKKDLPKAWKQTDSPANMDDEEETKIELPQSLREREKMVEAAQKKIEDVQIEVSHTDALIPADIPVPVFPSKSFEKWPTPSTPSTSLSTTLVIIVIIYQILII